MLVQINQRINNHQSPDKALLMEFPMVVLLMGEILIMVLSRQHHTFKMEEKNGQFLLGKLKKILHLIWLSLSLLRSNLKTSVHKWSYQNAPSSGLSKKFRKSLRNRPWCWKFKSNQAIHSTLLVTFMVNTTTFCVSLITEAIPLMTKIIFS